MKPFDAFLAVLGGVLSCLTPEALMLFPLFMAAAAAIDRISLVAIAAGLGLSLVLAGTLAVSVGTAFGFDAVWLRRAASLLLLIQGFILTRRSMVEQFPGLTGGSGGTFAPTGAIGDGTTVRQFALALLVGAVWIPRVGPTLGKASIMAADARSFTLSLGVVFVTGASAALPWILLGRVVRLILNPFAGGLLRGMAGKRLLGFALMIVAAAALTGQDRTLARWADPRMPAWIKTLAVRF